MKCPACKGVLLAEKQRHVEFNICSTCHGIWVAGYQFHGLAVKVAVEGKVESNSKLTFKPREALQPNPKNRARNCPQCYQAMREFNYGYDSNVFLDRCDECNGIWLDPNEIIDIAKHIQYNPDVDTAARDLIRNLDDSDNSEKGLEFFVNAVSEILELLIS